MGGGDSTEPAVDSTQIGEGAGDLGGGSGVGVEQFGGGDSLHTKQLTTEGTEGHGDSSSCGLRRDRPFVLPQLAVIRAALKTFTTKDTKDHEGKASVRSWMCWQMIRRGLRGKGF